MASSTPHIPQLGHEHHGGVITATFRADLACVQCAEAVERALRANPHIVQVHVDYPARTVHVGYHAGMVTTDAINALISDSAHGCRCAADDGGAEAGGGIAALAHAADMAAVTMGTSADRMQYEFPSTSAGRAHHAGHAAAPPSAPPAAQPHHDRHAGHAAPVDPAAHAGHGAHQPVVAAGDRGHAAPATGAAGHSAHGAMGHDMSDPRMAKAMEADMRTRFFVALALTIPTILFSPLAVNTFGLELVEMRTANWLMLLLSTPVVWWAGWPFIGGAATSLRYRQLNMSVLIATGVLAAWGFSLVITLISPHGETFYEAAAMLVTFVLFGHWMEMKSRRGTTDALRALFDLVPPTATVIRAGVERELPTSATACWSSRRPASTSRSSPANRYRWTRDPATRSWVGRSTAPARSSWKRRRSAARRRSPRSWRWYSRRRARRRRDSGWRTGRRPGW
jgi:P-type Cu2+ transporter